MEENMKKAILLTYKKLSDTSFIDIIKKDIPKAEWIYEEVDIKSINPIEIDMDPAVAVDAFNSGKYDVNDFDLIINTTFAEIIKAKDQNYELDMLQDQVEVDKKEWLDDPNHPIMQDFEYMGWSTWNDIVLFQISDALCNVSIVEIDM